MAKTKAVLGYMGAGLTLAAAVLTPFLLMGTFMHAVAHAGLHIDEKFTGGTVARSVEKGGYRIDVYNAVKPTGIRPTESFVQVDFTPAKALPAAVDEAVDLDGDGQPDVRVRFTLAADTEAALPGTVEALNPRYGSFTSPATREMTRIVAHIGDRVVVRVPVKESGR